MIWESNEEVLTELEGAWSVIHSFQTVWKPNKTK